MKFRSPSDKISPMKYEKIRKAKFIERPNRFVAYVELDGRREKVHVKNTGRCRELLVPGVHVILEDFDGRMKTRKLRYSLIAVKKELKGAAGPESLLINMDSQAPNSVVKEGLLSGSIRLQGMERLSALRAEYTYGASRLDFYIEDAKGRPALIEVKGVTLEQDGVARFPDAPTVRGIKHIEELIKAKAAGCHAAIIFVIQMKGVNKFEPNYETHPQFGEALKQAKDAGVEILAYDCRVSENELTIGDTVEVEL
ncbi:MAG: DNA/RNA nuclease SfsA [Bacillota bacterium]|nr:DNA/RNA nuclease SfsA [Bacillota bacterium]